MTKGQSTITEVHDYIREHYHEGDSVTLHDLRLMLPWLKDTNISSALNKLEKEERLEVQDFKKHYEECTHPFNVHVFTAEMFTDRKKSKKHVDHTRDIPLGKKTCSKRVFRSDEPALPKVRTLSKLRNRDNHNRKSELKSIVELLLAVAERLETYSEEN